MLVQRGNGKRRRTSPRCDPPSSFLGSVYVFDGSDAVAHSKALVVLTRLADRRADETRWLEAALRGRLERLVFPAMEVAVQNGEPLGAVLANIAGDEASLELAGAIYACCPNKSVALNNLSIVMIRKILTERAWSVLDIRSVQEKAKHLHNLALHERQEGALEEALTTILEATELSRCSDSPILLADCLNTSGLLRKDLGHKAEALKDFREAIELLADMEWQSGANCLSRALYYGNLASTLFDLGQFREAIKQSTKLLGHLESLEPVKNFVSRLDSQAPSPLWDSIFDEKSEEITAHYANSLNNRSNYLRSIGDYKEALFCANCACSIFKELAAESSDKYGFEYTRVLTTKGLALDEMQERSQALEVQIEVVKFRRKLAARYEDAYGPLLAGALDHLGMAYLDLDGYDQATACLTEAVGIYRKFMPRRFLAIAPELATTLSNLGLAFARMRRNQEAISAIQESVELYQELCVSQPSIHILNLANSLHNLGVREYQTGRQAEAISHTQQAVEFYRKLEEPFPEPLLVKVAYAFDNLARMLMETGKIEEAVQTALVSERYLRELVSINRNKYTVELCQTLANFSIMLWKTDSRDMALEKTKEVVDTLRLLNKDNSD